MNHRVLCFVLPRVLLILVASPCSAQQSGNLLDAARVILGPTDPLFRRLIDLDSDGRPDAVGMIALSPTQTQLGLYRNAGNGAFSPTWFSVINWTFAGEPTSALDKIVVGDFDGDGLKDDFAIALGYELLVFQGSGTGGPSAASSFLLPELSRGLTVTDVDQNGIDDLLIGTTVSLVPFRNPLQSGATLDSPLSSGSTLQSDVSILPIRLINGELAVIYPGWTWHYSSASGWNIAPNTILSVFGQGGVGDLDGDGDDDAVVFDDNGAAWVTRQIAGSQLAGPTLISSGPGPGILVDLDGDGDLDGVGGRAWFPAAPEVSSIQVSMNDGNGSFGVLQAQPFRNAGIPNIAGVTDLDGDGDLDILTGRCILFGNPNESHFDRPAGMVVYSLNGGPGNITIADIDDDGDLDLSPDWLGFLANDGRGTHRYRSSNFIGPLCCPISPVKPAVADWNLDGLPDLTFATGHGVHAAWNRGGGSFQWSPFHIAPLAAAPAFTWNHIAADLDSDGDLDSLSCDAYATNPSSPLSVTIAFNDGLASFPQVTTITGSGPCIGIGDFDNDGLVDVLTRPGPIALARHIPGGGFGTPIPIMTGTVLAGRALVDDIDGDGDLDIVCHDASGHLLLTNDGSANFTASSLLGTSFTNAPPPTFMAYALIDCTGDGIRDLVASPASETLECSIVLRGLGGGSFATTGPVHACLPASTGDIDGDGDLDLVEASHPYLHRNPRLQGATAPARAQYGVATAGSGGAAPILGVGGSLRELGVATLRIRNGLGGAPLWIAVTGSPTQLANYPLHGITTYVDPFSPSTLFFPPASLSGPANGIGVGTHDQSYTVPFGIAGFELHHQAFFFDPGGPSGASASNALRIRYGL